MPPKSQITAHAYDKDEKVLCFHGPLLYEAKVLELQQEDPKDKKSKWQYRVHYKGWKNTWDDWVPEDRIRKYNEDNRQLERELKRDMLRTQREEAAETARKKSSNAGTRGRRSEVGTRSGMRDSEDRASSVTGPRGTKRARETEIEKEEVFMNKPSIRIHVPDTLKGLLVDDWENVTKNLQLVPLPHRYSVSEILHDYTESERPRRKPGSADADILEEVVQGMREYFNKALGRILLYRFERQQWLELNHRMQGGQAPANGAALTNDEPDISGQEPYEVYGAEHLARLIVTMPELIAQTNMDQQAVSRLREELSKLTTWLSRNATKYFTKAYDRADHEYVAKARGTVVQGTA